MLLDPDRSWALLIGTSEYPRSPDLADIPAVRNNLSDLRSALTDPEIGRLPPDHCHVVEDPEDEHVVADALDRVATEARDALIVYYAGHGFIDDAPQPALYLGLRQTTQRLVVSNSMRFDVLRSFVGRSAAATRVLILDCCYSGIAAEGVMGETTASDIARLVPVQGSYVLTSSAATRTSMAPAGARYTAFTGELLRILNDGIPGGPPELDLETLYLHLRRSLLRRRLPEPQCLRSNTAHHLALVLNRASAAPWAAPRKKDSARHNSSSTAGRRWVALELRRLRLAAGLSQAEIARLLGCAVRNVSLIESGQRSIETKDLVRLLEVFAVPDERRPEYIGAAEMAQYRGWWEEYGPPTLPEWATLFVGLEQGAERIRAYQPAVAHGLLQTKGYATALLRGTTRSSEERIARLVEVRLQRQESLLRERNPTKFWVIVDEAALRHRVGDDEVMRSELRHMAELATRRDNVTIQVVPFDKSPSEASYAAFTILNFPFPNDPGIVHLEQWTGGVILEDLADVDTFSYVFQQEAKRALSPDESVAMLLRAADAWGA